MKANIRNRMRQAKIMKNTLFLVRYWMQFWIFLSWLITTDAIYAQPSPRTRCSSINGGCIGKMVGISASTRAAEDSFAQKNKGS